MCHHCVVESVKSRMLSRRDCFRGSAVGAGGAGLGSFWGGIRHRF